MLSKKIRKIISEAIANLYGKDLSNIEFQVERPRVREHGDFAVNVAFILSKKLKQNPRKIGSDIVKYLETSSYFSKVEVAGPGFVNLFLSSEILHDELREILLFGENYAQVDIYKGMKIQVEFVSANPVGPMHIGHGRWAAYGDTLARMLEKSGADVTREFYINDAGRQMDIFAESVACRYSELFGEKPEFPEEGYRGHYIVEIAREIADKYGDEFMKINFEERKQLFKDVAYKMVLEHLKKVLNKMDVRFDVWFSERTLHESGKLEQAVKMLEEKGFVYRKDGAVWFRSTDFGDEKDRVLIRSNGEPTYFLADIAYHIDKKERGFDKVIDIWGADHHGYVPRMVASMQALGYGKEFLEVIIGQMVNLLSGGKPVRMSKRTGEMITLEELMEEVGKDALRFFFVSKSTDSTLDFDIDLAREQSQKNPVYYVQYAHARICSIIRKAEEEGLKVNKDEVELVKELNLAEELDLIYLLSLFPETVEVCAKTRDVHHLPSYLIELASNFHSFYQKVRVIGEDEKKSKARILLINGVKTVMSTGLSLIGVSSPERM
ncbi:MAG: arginine--tRNA ligase [Actinobacteria bacterium]|nr:arginine--tRNA ligase [Actinomycetota bacterium]